MKYVVAGYYGFKNSGDELILSKIIEDIRYIDKKADIWVWSGDVKYTEKIHNVNAFDRFSPDETEQAVETADVVIVGGGGLIQEYYDIHIKDLFREFGKNIPSYATVPLLGKIYSKPVFYWAHGVGPVFSEKAKRFICWFYRLADCTTVRDPYSLNFLERVCQGSIEPILDVDPVFALDIEKFVSDSKQYNLPDNILKIGINLRSWFGIQKSLPEISRVLQKLKQDGYEIVPVPFDLKIDTKILREAFKGIPGCEKNIQIMENLSTPADVITLTQKIDVFIGTRLHSIIISSLLKKPTLSIVYDQKVRSYAEMIGLPTINIGEITYLELYKKSKSIIESLNDKGFGQQIEEKLREIKNNYKTSDIFSKFLNDHDTTFTNSEKLSHIHHPSTAQENETSLLEHVILSLKNELKALREENEKLTYKLNEVRDEKNRLQEQLQSTVSEFEQFKTESENALVNLKNSLQSIASERDMYLNYINDIHNSDFWKVANWFHEKRKKNLFFKTIYRSIKAIKSFSKTLKEPEASTSHISENQQETQKNVLSDIKSFIESAPGPVWIVYAGVKFSDLEGQRSVRLTQNLIKIGMSVIYVYYNWGKNDATDYGVPSKNLFLLSKDDFFENKNYEMIIEYLKLKEAKHALLIEYPEHGAAKVLIKAREAGLITIYDILDDWEDFKAGNIAPWYDQDIEYFVLRNSDFRFAVSPSLVKKFEKFNVKMLPNGFAQDKLVDKPPAQLQKGDVTIGYFGYLEKGVFDWDLIIETAKNNSNFLFYIIGYAMPKNLKLPDNVKYLGKIHPSNLSAHVKLWDVCINPKTKVFKSSDPIKVYEYLYFGKPVVVTGGIQHSQNYPYVFYSTNNPKEFEKKILEAKNTTIDKRIIEDFLKDKSWLERTKQLLEEVGYSTK